MTVTITLGNFTFEPTPIISINDQILRTGGAEAFGKVTQMQLNGTLLAYGGQGGGCQASFEHIINKQQELRDSIDCSGCYPFTILCGEDVVLQTYARVNTVAINESQDNWVQSAPYTVELEYNQHSGQCNPCLISISNDWTLEPLELKTFVDESGCSSETQYYRITHNLAAQGVECCSETGSTPGWVIAKQWVYDNLSGTMPELTSGIIDVDGISSLSLVDHSRTISSSETEGTYSLQESWTAVLSGDPPTCMNDYTVEESFSSQERYRVYSINGTVTGFEQRDANFDITSTKLANAIDCWQSIEPQLTGIILCHSNISGCPLNPIPISSSVTKSPRAGTISYNYVYNQRPLSFFTNAISETISINDNFPTLVVAEIPILGRLSGPLLHNTNTTTSTRRHVSINAVFAPSLNCSEETGVCDRFTFLQNELLSGEPSINQMLCCLETSLESAYPRVYRIEDQRNIDILAGSYNREVTWIYQDCSGDILLTACDFLQ